MLFRSETWGIASPLPREHIPKRSRPKDQRSVRIVGEIKRDWGFLKGSVGSIPLQLLEIEFHVEIHAIEWHDFEHETQFHGVVVA